MGKQGKRRKNLLKKFEDIDDNKILSILKEKITQYIILEQSEKQAIQILKKYGIENEYSLNDDIKKEYFTMIEVANLRNITIPKEWYNIQISEKEVIKRIIEFETDEISWISEHNYLFDSCYEDNENINEMSSSQKIDEVTSMYEDIILKEFAKSNTKSLKRVRKLIRDSYEL